MRITDSSVFPASKTIAAALVEIEPGSMRELHWHPTADEWQYYLSGEARMTIFAAENRRRCAQLVQTTMTAGTPSV